MSYWKDEPWASCDALMAELETMYGKAIAAGKVTDPADTAVRKMIHYRNWCSSVSKSAVRRVVEELEVVYCPKGLGPGPGLVFPMRDITGEIKRLHIRLLEDSPTIYKMKYMSLVDPTLFLGPAWIGADDATMEAIIQCGEVQLVEGPVDLAAVRIAGCPIPSLSPTSKRLTEEHWTWLRVMGVKCIHPMMDNEVSGGGGKAASYFEKNPYGISVAPDVCPVKDPSKALEDPFQFLQLKASFTPTTMVLLDDLD